MFFLDGLIESDIWTLGDFAGQQRGKKALARAEILESFIRELELIVTLDPKDHARHVNVEHWPISKDEQKAIALEFCIKSPLFLRIP